MTSPTEIMKQQVCMNLTVASWVAVTVSSKLNEDKSSHSIKSNLKCTIPSFSKAVSHIDTFGMLFSKCSKTLNYQNIQKLLLKDL